MKVEDLIANPIIVKGHLLNEVLIESALKQAVLNNLDEVLYQLGYGFAYVGQTKYYEISYYNELDNDCDFSL